MQLLLLPGAVLKGCGMVPLKWTLKASVSIGDMGLK